MFRRASLPFAACMFLWKFLLTSAIDVSIEHQCTLLDDECSPIAHSALQAPSLLQSDARRNEAMSPIRSRKPSDDEVMQRIEKEKPESIRSLESRVRMLESRVDTAENADSTLHADSERSTSSKAQGEAVQPVYSNKCSTADKKQCVFGVDARDEGSHCIPELDYGQYGWCYTRKDMTTWGSCTSSCPLSGRFGVLQRKLTDVSGKMKELQDEVDDMPDCIESKGVKKAPKSGAKTPPDNNPKDDAPQKIKKSAKSDAKAPAKDDVKNDDKDNKSGSKLAVRRASDSLARRRVATDTISRTHRVAPDTISRTHRVAPDTISRTHRVAPDTIARTHRSAPDSFGSRHKVAMSGIKASSRSVAKRSPQKQRELKKEPLMLKWNKKMALQAKSDVKEH